MSSRSEGLRIRLERLNRRREKAYALAGRAAKAASGRGQPVRHAVMLLQAEHIMLREWCRTTAVELGRTRVTGQDVLRLLVIRLLSDPILAGQLRADLAAGRARRRGPAAEHASRYTAPRVSESIGDPETWSDAGHDNPRHTEPSPGRVNSPGLSIR